ncbi:MAG TPA: patatin-like phospholipase family protein [bacterium]|jgi:NTE family protein|nr:patatin-like phospholipase family protein [bacterium]
MTKTIMAVSILVLLFLSGKSLADDNSIVPEAIDPFALTFDLSQGLATSAVINTPYRFSGKLAPELRFDDFGLGIVGQFRYDNPFWDFGLGLREEFLFAKLAPNTGLRLILDETPWLNVPKGLVEGGVVADFSGIARTGLWYGWDTQTNVSTIMLSTGIDLQTLGKLIFPPTSEPRFNNHLDHWSSNPSHNPSSVMPEASVHKIALVVSGGGSTGAWAMGVIQYLMEKKHIRFDMFCGTSTGSLMAPLLVTGDLKDLLAIYGTVKTKDIFRINTPSDMVASGSIFSTGPLQNLIWSTATEDRWKKIKDSSLQIIITTVCLQTSQAVYFYTGPEEVKTKYPDAYLRKHPGFPADGNQSAIRIQDHDTLMRAMLASCVAPVVGPATHIPKGSPYQYSDGGVEEYAPISVALLNGADEVYAIVLSPSKPIVQKKQFRDMVGTIQQTINIFADRVDQANVAEAQDLAATLGKRLMIIRPDVTLTGDSRNPNDFDPATMSRLINEGYQKAEQMFP